MRCVVEMLHCGGMAFTVPIRMYMFAFQGNRPLLVKYMMSDLCVCGSNQNLGLLSVSRLYDQCCRMLLAQRCFTVHVHCTFGMG